MEFKLGFSLEIPNPMFLSLSLFLSLLLLQPFLGCGYEGE